MEKVVIRRVGGLEDKLRCIRVIARVIRRVGGLEVHILNGRTEIDVIRRVGGLEVLQDIFQT